jgi:hypothetical protein
LLLAIDSSEEEARLAATQVIARATYPARRGKILVWYIHSFAHCFINAGI